MSFFFSICCLAKNEVTNANAPPIKLANHNIVVPLNEPTIVTPSVLIVSPIVFDNFHYESFINKTKELKVREEVPIRNPL
ncbi:MAG TPA: hypothetical protein VE593_11205 [Nitrososphaeraceae archaeon]|nr:hypothetical protein [Nitrososphaeraceae archaeon]